MLAIYLMVSLCHNSAPIYLSSYHSIIFMTTSAPDSRIPPTFRDLALHPAVLEALNQVGYESPSPIQAATIPPLLAGRDVVGQAQTGTGKTAAFALPILSRLDPEKSKLPQALVLAPTRELAIQVAEAFQRYATHIPGFHVLPIYGGQSYGPQLGGLRRGVHVVVGTPGRVIDHLERGSLDLSGLSCLVLDEADEMLRMGFIDDVETVLKSTPPQRQIALFSATMPAPIRKIAQKYLNNPAEISIKSKTTTAANIRHRYWMVSGVHKLDALTRILEVETFDGMIIFTRTKQSTEELAEKLLARGFSAAAINGDIPQQQRERAIEKLKNGQLDILVATDVAARGLDVERISHVVNFDIPYDVESYVHRVGRTGRAGRSGQAILFVAPRERRLLSAIEHTTRQPIERMDLPSVNDVNVRRIEKFKQQVSHLRETIDIAPYRLIVEQFEQEYNIPIVEIAATLARLAQGDTPLLLEISPATFETPSVTKKDKKESSRSKARSRQGERENIRHPANKERKEHISRAEGNKADKQIQRSSRKSSHRTEMDMETFRIEVGHEHGVRPGNIVGAIANEAGLDAKYIGQIDIHDAHSLIDLPADIPSEVLRHLKKVWVAGRQLKITHMKKSLKLSNRV